jgi:hypothetical protein
MSNELTMPVTGKFSPKEKSEGEGIRLTDSRHEPITKTQLDTWFDQYAKAHISNSSHATLEKLQGFTYDLLQDGKRKASEFDGTNTVDDFEFKVPHMRKQTFDTIQMFGLPTIGANDWANTEKELKTWSAKIPLLRYRDDKLAPAVTRYEGITYLLGVPIQKSSDTKGSAIHLIANPPLSGVDKHRRTQAVLMWMRALNKAGIIARITKQTVDQRVREESHSSDRNEPKRDKLKREKLGKKVVKMLNTNARRGERSPGYAIWERVSDKTVPWTAYDWSVVKILENMVASGHASVLTFNDCKTTSDVSRVAQEIKRAVEKQDRLLSEKDIIRDLPLLPARQYYHAKAMTSKRIPPPASFDSGRASFPAIRSDALTDLHDNMFHFMPANAVDAIRANDVPRWAGTVAASVSCLAMLTAGTTETNNILEDMVPALRKQIPARLATNFTDNLEKLAAYFRVAKPFVEPVSVDSVKTWEQFNEPIRPQAVASVSNVSSITPSTVSSPTSDNVTATARLAKDIEDIFDSGQYQHLLDFENVAHLPEIVKVSIIGRPSWAAAGANPQTALTELAVHIATEMNVQNIHQVIEMLRYVKDALRDLTHDMEQYALDYPDQGTATPTQGGSHGSTEFQVTQFGNDDGAAKH